MMKHVSSALKRRGELATAVGLLGLLGLFALPELACSGSVVFENHGGGGAGGEGAGATTTAQTTTTTGEGGATTTTGEGGGTAIPCEILGHAACLGAYPQCVPIYDDECCPSCDPMGGCADCVNFQFHHCAYLPSGCQGFECGFPLMDHCAGGVATCGDPGGSPSPCGKWPGCTYAECPEGFECDSGPYCTPVNAGSCTTFCDSIPPPCPDGFVAEGNGSCYTGMCIEANVCESP